MRTSQVAAINKLAVAGEQAGFSLEQMIELLDSGLAVETLLELIAWRLRPCRLCQGHWPHHLRRLADDVISPVPDRPLTRTSSFQFFYLPLYQFIEFCHPAGQWARSLNESACKVPSSGCDLRGVIV